MQQIAADKLQTPMSHSRNYRKSEGKKMKSELCAPDSCADFLGKVVQRGGVFVWCYGACC